jgi:glycosyltransferase involved in cell wall biosynthesis
MELKINNLQRFNIHIIFSDPFPIGLANANRIISLFKELASQGNKIKIHCIRPTEKKENIINNNIIGTFQDIDYHYTANTVIWPDSKLFKLFLTIKGVLYSVFLLFKSKINREIDLLIITISGFGINIIYFIICSILRVKIIYSIDEFPKVILEKSKYNAVYRYLYLNFFHKIFDGWIIMTNTLYDFYNKYARPNSKKIIIPMTVEPERFLNLNRIDGLPDKYLAYCGNLGQNNKDGLQTLILAFSIFLKKLPDFHLIIIGDTKTKQFHEFQELINLSDKLGIRDKIIFTGRIHRNLVPDYLSHAKALLLSRPNNIQAEGGFPTKLGEYLATGNPVVVTRVGEIPHYLYDRINAFIAEPDNPENFASKMIEVFNDYETSKKIGIEGQKLTQTVFNGSFQSEKLKTFLMELIDEQQN